VNTIPLYILHAEVSQCTVSITSVDMGNTVQLLHVMQFLDFMLRK